MVISMTKYGLKALSEILSIYSYIIRIICHVATRDVWKAKQHHRKSGTEPQRAKQQTIRILHECQGWIDKSVRMVTLVRHKYGIFSMDLEVGYKVFFLMDSCR